MIAPIVGNDGKFKSLHRTWIDLAQPRARAVFIDPDTLEPITKTKKYAGSTAAGHIEIVGVRAPRQIVIAEGIETGLSAYTALAACGRDLSATAFWTSLDLGNLGGRALDRVGRHPGPTPDPDAPAITLPDCVQDVVLLGDHDSDPTLTRCAVYRASMRWARDNRTVRVAWAPEKKDFNDLLMVA
jgi:hypothetical protein